MDKLMIVLVFGTICVGSSLAFNPFAFWLQSLSLGPLPPPPLPPPQPSKLSAPPKAPNAKPLSYLKLGTPPFNPPPLQPPRAGPPAPPPPPPRQPPPPQPRQPVFPPGPPAYPPRQPAYPPRQPAYPPRQHAYPPGPPAYPPQYIPPPSAKPATKAPEIEPQENEGPSASVDAQPPPPPRAPAKKKLPPPTPPPPQYIFLDPITITPPPLFPQPTPPPQLPTDCSCFSEKDYCPFNYFYVDECRNGVYCCTYD